MMTRAAAPTADRALLAAAGLPARWSGADAFTVLELDLGDAGALLEALRAWRADPARCRRLHWAALAPHLPSRDALAQTLAAHALPSPFTDTLLARWPPPVRGVHRIELDGGRVRIAIAIGVPRDLLPGWLPHADALLVPARAGPPHDAAVLRTAGAMLVAGGLAGIVAAPNAPRAAIDATLAALSSAGLACEALGAQYDGNAWRAVRVRGRMPSADPPRARQALVVGAGLAGAASAAALARRGWSVVRIDAGPLDDAAATGSQQPVLAQHPSVSPDDAPLSRLTRAATLLASAIPGAEALRPLGRVQCVDETIAERAARALPPEWVRAVDAAQASALAGVRLRRGGLWLPRACAADPRALREAWTLGGLRPVENRRVARLESTGAGWLAADAHGAPIAEAAVAVLACGAGQLAIVRAPGTAPASLATLLGPTGARRRIGATTLARPTSAQRPSCIVGGDGHAVPIDGDQLLIGPAPDDATHAAGLRPDAAARHVDAHAHAPASAWRRWAGQLADPGVPPPLRAGPAGSRLSTRDHLPLAGRVPDAERLRLADADRGDPRTPLAGLWIASALGGRGLLWSVLCAELIAASLEGEPAPIERALVRHLAPERFLLRALRRPDTSG